MKVWMLFVQGDDHTWLEAAWDDESTAENHAGWQAEADRVSKLAHENRWAWRVMEVEVPGVFDAFDVPAVTASPAREEG